MKEIGIIYCPTHKPFCSSLKRWKKMAAILDAKGVEYDMALSETSHSVERLFMKMIDQGYTTIVIAGGDSALYDAVNALMRKILILPRREKISVRQTQVRLRYSSDRSPLIHCRS